MPPGVPSICGGWRALLLSLTRLWVTVFDLQNQGGFDQSGHIHILFGQSILDLFTSSQLVSTSERVACICSAAGISNSGSTTCIYGIVPSAGRTADTSITALAITVGAATELADLLIALSSLSSVGAMERASLSSPDDTTTMGDVGMVA